MNIKILLDRWILLFHVHNVHPSRLLHKVHLIDLVYQVHFVYRVYLKDHVALLLCFILVAILYFSMWPVGMLD